MNEEGIIPLPDHETGDDPGNHKIKRSRMAARKSANELKVSLKKEGFFLDSLSLI